MEPFDMAEWASDEIKTITLTQVFLHAPFQLRVRRFVPKEGDMLNEKWQDGDKTLIHNIPPYAMASLQETKEMYREFIYRNICTYINGVIEDRKLPQLFAETYARAVRHRLETKVCSLLYHIYIALTSVATDR